MLQTRWRWGQLTDCEPSRFLYEIDEEFLDWEYQTKGNFKTRNTL